MGRQTNRLASRGADFGDSSLNITYRNVRNFIVFFVNAMFTNKQTLIIKKTLILAVVGVPAALAATWAVQMPYIGRKGTLAISSGKLFHTNISLIEKKKKKVHYSTNSLRTDRVN